MNAKEVESVILAVAPLSNGLAGDPNGLLYGDPDTEITGVAVTWTPTVKVLSEAAAAGLNCVLTHEIPFFPGTQSDWFRTLPEDDKPHNIARKAILDAHNMVVVRSHSNWDGTSGGIMDTFAETLGFTDYAYKGTYCCTYRIQPTTLAELANHAKLRLAVPQVRVAGDPAMQVEVITAHYGGLAQQFHAVDEAVIADADAIICGEALDYSFRAAVDAGLGFIETSHVNSENPGMRKFARLIAARLTEMPVRFIDARMPWVYF